jgi:hypothetical protein
VRRPGRLTRQRRQLGERLRPTEIVAVHAPSVTTHGGSSNGL